MMKLSEIKIQCGNCLRERVSLKVREELGRVCPGCGRYLAITNEEVSLDDLIATCLALEKRCDELELKLLFFRPIG